MSGQTGQTYYNPVEFGYELDARIVPNYKNGDPRQIYAMVEDYYFHGGFRVCDTIGPDDPLRPSLPEDPVSFPNYRNWISFDKRKLGMLVFTIDDGKFWQLINNPSGYTYYEREDRITTNNSDWVEVSFNSDLLFEPHSGLEYTTPSGNTARTIYNTALDPATITTEKVGGFSPGITAGSISGKTLVEIIDILLFPNVFPTYTIPTIILISNALSSYEIGSTISPLLTLDATKNDANAFTLLNLLRGITTIASTVSPIITSASAIPPQFGHADPNNPNFKYELLYTDSGYIIPATVSTSPSITTYVGNGTYGSGLPKQDSKNVYDTRAYAVRLTDHPQLGASNFTSNQITINGWYPYFYGKTLTSSTPADIVNIIQSGSGFGKVIADGAGTITANFNSVGEWPWFAVYSPFPDKTKWSDTNEANNNGDIGLVIGGPNPDLFSSAVILPINSSDGFWSGINFKIYVSQKVTTLNVCDLREI
jgi:hypothetical protein